MRSTVRLSIFLVAAMRAAAATDGDDVALAAVVGAGDRAGAPQEVRKAATSSKPHPCQRLRATATSSAGRTAADIRFPVRLLTA
jgi:hypothetical protein